MNNFYTKKLSPEDWKLFRTMRIEMTTHNPEFFLESAYQARARPNTHWQSILKNPLNALFLLYNQESFPIGLSGNFHYDPLPENTREIGMLYIAPDYRGKGLAKNLFKICIAADKTIARFVSGHRIGNIASEQTIKSMDFIPTHTTHHIFGDGKEYCTQEYELKIER